MSFELTELEALDLWRRAIVSSVRLDAPDLTARQMALLLTVYLTPPPHTVRGVEWRHFNRVDGGTRPWTRQRNRWWRTTWNTT